MIAVIEPHADDAFLSLGGHLRLWRAEGRPVVIVTVFGSPERTGEAASYAAALGADHVGCGLPEGGGGNGTDWLTEIPGSVREALGRIGDGEALWPLGIHHPEHRALGEVAPEWADRYVELPYSIVTANAEETTSALAGRAVRSWLRPTAAKYRDASHFKSQSRFMYYNLPALRSAVEVIVGPR